MTQTSPSWYLKPSSITNYSQTQRKYAGMTDYEIVTNATKQSIRFEKGLWDWKRSYIVFI